LEIPPALTWAMSFISSSDFVSDFSKLETPVASLDQWLLKEGNRPTPTLLVKHVKQLTGKSPGELISSSLYETERRRISFSLAALTLFPSGKEKLRNELLRAMYIFGLLERLAAQTPALKTADDVHDFLINGIILLPSNFPRPEESLARRPAVADLKVVRQELLRYEMGEAAHIENVLKGESKERIHRRTSTREEVITLEAEKREEREQDLQSTERFELQKEAAKTISEDISLQAGVTVTGSYGPSVSVTANAGFAYNFSKEESSREASNYARDVTERSAIRVQERIREQRVTRILTEVEETNKHGLNNVNGTDHVIGIYRWVDKVYRAQVFNYGRRLILEFIVPEPAAFFLHSQAGQRLEGVTMKEPEPPVIGENPPVPLSPFMIDERNYLTYVGKYSVANVNPPPPEEIIVSQTWEEPAKEPPRGANRDFYKALKGVAIPDGYKADEFTVAVYSKSWNSDVYVSVGKVNLWGSTTHVGVESGESMPFQTTGRLAGETGQLPVSLVIMDSWGYAMSLEVKCRRMNETFAQWQLKTYEDIMRAYYELKAQYDEQVSAARVRQGVTIAGRNPIENRSIERTELKKNAISLLRKDHFIRGPDTDPIKKYPPESYPEVDFDVAGKERDVIQFFEQAFEWQNITYVFYPYYWGRKPNWVSASQLSDPDPIFTSFLRAGAARVAVPVRPGFEQAISLYLGTGMIWNGSQVPQIGDPLYVSLINEIQEQQDMKAGGTSEGDPWEVRLPTTLVILQKDANLPVYVP